MERPGDEKYRLTGEASCPDPNRHVATTRAKRRLFHESVLRDIRAVRLLARSYGVHSFRRQVSSCAIMSVGWVYPESFLRGASFVVAAAGPALESPGGEVPGGRLLLSWAGNLGVRLSRMCWTRARCCPMLCSASAVPDWILARTLSAVYAATRLWDSCGGSAGPWCDIP